MAFGSTINPGYMNTDYSGVERAGHARAQAWETGGEIAKKAVAAFTMGMTGLPMEAGGITDMLKQQKGMEQEANSIASIADVIAKKAPDMFPGIEDVSRKLQDKEIPLSQRINEALAFKQALGMSFKIDQEQRAAQEAGIMDMLRLQQIKESDFRMQPPSHPGTNAFDFSHDTGGGSSVPQAGFEPLPQMEYGYPQHETPMGSWIRGQGTGFPQGSYPARDIFVGGYNPNMIDPSLLPPIND